MVEKEKISRVVAIKRYFSTEGKPITLTELKALSTEERIDLGDFCLVALDCELKPLVV